MKFLIRPLVASNPVKMGFNLFHPITKVVPKNHFLMRSTSSAQSTLGEFYSFNPSSRLTNLLSTIDKNQQEIMTFIVDPENWTTK